MKTLYLNLGMGAAGDMLTAALYELLSEDDKIMALKAMQDINIPGVMFIPERSEKCGIVGTHMRVSVNGEEENEGMYAAHHIHDVDESMHAVHHVHDEDESMHAAHHIHDVDESMHAVHHVHDEEESMHAAQHRHGTAAGQDCESWTYNDIENEGVAGSNSNAGSDFFSADHSAADAGTAEKSTGHGTDNSAPKTKLNLSPKVREDFREIYRIIGRAESKAHGVPVKQVHFHELAEADAIADISAVCLLMDMIKPERVVASPINVGGGKVRCAHGIMPVPAPATANILMGIPIYGSDIRAELCTPTGAALVRYFADEFGPMPRMKVSAIGYGMGKKDFEAANCVVAMLGDSYE